MLDCNASGMGVESEYWHMPEFDVPELGKVEAKAE